MNNISITNQVLRLALSLGIVFAVLNASGPIGSLVYALFLSAYAGITAAIGWDPAIALLDLIHHKMAERSAHRHHDHLAHS